MTDPKEKGDKPQVRAREPKKATAPGIFDNLRQLPHPVEEIMGLTLPSNDVSVPAQPSPTQPDVTQPNPTQNIAPNRDFNRRANSLDRDALPSGLFPGASKKLYDALYMRTRGAIIPVRTIQATKRELMFWSGIKSKNTIAVNLQLLTANGLLGKQMEIGDHGGSVYEVILPGEIFGQFNPTQPNPAQPVPTQPNPTQKLGGDPTQFLGWVGLGNLVESKGTSSVSKTSFKTNTERSDDDEAFATMCFALRQAAKDITGKEPSASESPRWAEVAEVLITEFKIAASRTTVSSAPSFLAEHLRRRLFKKEKAQLEREEREVPGNTMPKVDRGKCTDCGGTGYWYPEGYEKGVARCSHEKLLNVK